MGIFFIRNLKNLVIGIVIGLLVGLWFGSNLGKGKSIFSNPLADDSIQSKIKMTGNKVIEQSGKALEKSGRALRDTVASDK